MATAYPEGTDEFTEPKTPETVSLSARGAGGTRNHVEHHRDLGDAIKKMQELGVLVDHDHSGEEPVRSHGSKLVQANTHEDPDTDKTDNSLHHTIGTGPHQAAPGDHSHDYTSLVGAPYIIVPTLSAAPQPVEVGTMIYEQDTNRVRAWSTFLNNEAAVGRDSRDDYNAGATDATGNASLNTDDWEQWYSRDSSHGAMGVPVAGFASWVDASSETNRCIARRKNSLDAVTETNDQIITWKTGDIVIQRQSLGTEKASNDKYFRLSPDLSSYVRLQIGNDWIALWYTLDGPDGEKPLGRFDNINTNTPYIEWSGELKGRIFTLRQNGAVVGTIKDTQNASRIGSNNRGWGTGMQAGHTLWGMDGEILPGVEVSQITPANEDWIRIQDVQYYASTARWTLLAVAQVPIVRLRQSKAQRIEPEGTYVEWDAETDPPEIDHFGFFDKTRSQTDIVIREPGLYQIESTIQWNQQVVPDQGSMILVVNGQDTGLQDHRFMRGNSYAPGFSQTLSIAAKMRFVKGDVLRVKVKYPYNSGLVGKIFSFFDANSKIYSRLDLQFQTP